MKTLNVIGAGRVGRTLASLWEEKHTFAVQDVLDGSEKGARSAVAFIGDGTPVMAIAEMRPGDIWMITTPDRQIVATAEALASCGRLRADDVVFHCSGSMSSADLAAVAAAGALVASVHPLKTFAEPRDAVRTFTGTHCAAEGDRAALEVLQPAFERIGGNVSLIDAQAKIIYHAASVIVCNYLNALVETGLRCYEKAGLARENASGMIEPILRETLDNVIRLGPAHALTGPIARGDAPVVARHLEALESCDPRVAEIYRGLGNVAVELARARGDAQPEALDRIETLLALSRADITSRRT
ncbi:MAG: Rossmann-like and DUF2520 domain-containing protein [Burkholderiales bacterium]